MADTKIEWATKVLNVNTGCNKVSPGCANCFAERMTKRLQAMGQKKYADGFEFRIHPEALPELSYWHGERVFINSMSDLFHERQNPQFLRTVFDYLIPRTDNTFMILTKRAERMRAFMEWLLPNGAPPHIWLGVSVELPKYRERIEILKTIPAAVRFVSFEPLLSEMGEIAFDGISWAIVGGESGPHYRKMEESWAEGIKRQAVNQGVAFFYKQGSGPRHGMNPTLFGQEWHQFPQPLAGIPLLKVRSTGERRRK